MLWVATAAGLHPFPRNRFFAFRVASAPAVGDRIVCAAFLSESYRFG
jgi:hypothetical protein